MDFKGAYTLLTWGWQQNKQNFFMEKEKLKKGPIFGFYAYCCSNISTRKTPINKTYWLWNKMPILFLSVKDCKEIETITKVCTEAFKPLQRGGSIWQPFMEHKSSTRNGLMNYQAHGPSPLQKRVHFNFVGSSRVRLLLLKEKQGSNHFR